MDISDISTIKMVDINAEDYLPHFELALRDEFKEFFSEDNMGEAAEDMLRCFLWAYEYGFNDAFAAIIDLTVSGEGIEITGEMAADIQARFKDND